MSAQMLCFMPHPKITHTHLQRHRPKWWEDIISAGTWNKKWKANHSKNKPRQHLDFSLWASQLWCCFSHKCCQDHLPKTAHGRIFFLPMNKCPIILPVDGTQHVTQIHFKILQDHLPAPPKSLFSGNHVYMWVFRYKKSTNRKYTEK